LISLAALAGLVLAASVAAAAEYLDDSLRNRERVLAATGLIALGEIPQIEEAAGWNRPASRRVVESYRLLLTSLQVATLDRNVRKIMVASAGIGEGKSLTSSNLAAIFAETGRRVILVDADLHRPTQMLAFNLPNRDGLTTLMLDQGRPASSLLRETTLPNLKVITSGPSVADPSGLFSSKRLEDRLTELCALCDVLIFDTPPIVAQPDAVILGSHMDAVLFVVDASKSRGRVVTRTVEMLNDSGAAVVGVVLNRVPKKSTAYYYGYYGDYDRSGDEHRQNGAAAANDVGGRVAEEESTRAGQKR
jgi:capsular exopolysaccharide synthesis family protein